MEFHKTWFLVLCFFSIYIYKVNNSILYCEKHNYADHTHMQHFAAEKIQRASRQIQLGVANSKLHDLQKESDQSNSSAV